MTTVALKSLTKRYTANTAAISDITLSVADGELLVLLGPSGSGKSTILRLIAGLMQPSSGDILLDGVSVLKTPPEKRGAVMVFQEHALFPFMTVGDNVAFGLKRQKLPKPQIAQQVAAALESVQLGGMAQRWPDELSGGQRQRVALARALVIRPKLLLLDEPLSNLDPALRDDLRTVIGKLQREHNITTLLVTHDQSEAVAMADRIALLLNGKLRQIGKPSDFYQAPVDADVARFFGGINFFQGRKSGHVVQTALGELLVKSAAADGNVTLTIRPEAIVVGEGASNNLLGTIHKITDKGTHVDCCVMCRGVEVICWVSAETIHQVGDPITLHLPANRLISLPVEAV